MAVTPVYKRILLKLSGEAFAGGGGLGVDPDVVRSIAAQIADVVRGGAEVAVVSDHQLDLLADQPPQHLRDVRHHVGQLQHFAHQIDAQRKARLADLGAVRAAERRVGEAPGCPAGTLGAGT